MIATSVGEQQDNNMSSPNTTRQHAHVQGEQQGSDVSSCDIVDLPIASRKEPQTKAGKPPEIYRYEQDTIVAKKALQTI